MQDFPNRLMATLAADGNGILVAVGSAILLTGALLLRSYWSLWRHGIETQATILKTYGGMLADISFQDLTGQVHRIERCLPPRYGNFVEGYSRPLTYLPRNPAGWEWRPRSYHRFMTFFSLYIAALGLGLIGAGVSPLFAAQLHEVRQALFPAVPRPGWMEALPPPAPRPMPH